MKIKESYLNAKLRNTTYIYHSYNIGTYYLVPLVAKSNNLFVTSKNEFSNSPIHEFKELHK